MTKVDLINQQIEVKQLEIQEWHKELIKRTKRTVQRFEASMRGWQFQGQDEGVLKSTAKYYTNYLNYCVQKIWDLQKEINQLFLDLAEVRKQEVTK